MEDEKLLRYLETYIIASAAIERPDVKTLNKILEDYKKILFGKADNTDKNNDNIENKLHIFHQMFKAGDTIKMVPSDNKINTDFKNKSAKEIVELLKEK